MFDGFIERRKQNNFLGRKLEKFEFSGFSPSGFRPNFLVVTIAFSNANVIRHQVRLMDKYIKDKFTHLVIDNSDLEEQARIIKEICGASGRLYIRLSHNFYGRGSNSHALALNWTYRQVVLRYQPDYFGFLDHDIYPVKEEEIIPILNRQLIHGHLQERPPYWYLWPGLCFFKRTELFTPEAGFGTGNVNGVNVDTGGMLYKSVYSRLEKDKIEFPLQRYERLREGELTQSDQVEYIGNWMHSFNGSYWIAIRDKEKELEELINKYLA